MLKLTKKRRLVYKDDEARVAKLEHYLFGKALDANELAAAEEDVSVDDGGHGAHIFFEDREGSDVDVNADDDTHKTSSSDDDEADEREVHGLIDTTRRPTADKSSVENASGSGHDEDEDGNDAVEEAAAARRARSSEATARQAGKASPTKASRKKGSAAAVWTDADDAKLQVPVARRNMLRKLRQSADEAVMNGIKYEAALRAQHAALHPRTAWATSDAAATKARRKASAVAGYGSDSDDDEDEGDVLVRTAGGLLSRSGGRVLPAGRVEVTRVADGNVAAPSESVVQSVEFHPAGTLLLTAGFDKRLRLFQVDGTRNPLLHSIFLDDMPIKRAAFVCGGTRVLAAGRRPFFYLAHLETGQVERVHGPAGMKSCESFAVTPLAGGPSSAPPLAAFLGDAGVVSLVSLASRKTLGSLKMAGTVKSAAMSADGNDLITAGGDGVIYIWDVRQRTVRQRTVDHGSLGPTSITMSRNGKFVATGSTAGVVNVYRTNQLLPKPGAGTTAALPQPPVTAAPLRELMNLTTTVDSLAFSPDSNLLAISSRMKRDAVRLVHVPSLTVFSNWPASGTPLHYVHSLAFSPGGGYLAIGNAQGKALLYRLNHYTEA